MDQKRLLDRFLSYVRVNTTAHDATDAYPSSPGQLELGRQLVAELHEMGIDNAEQDDNGLIWATVPASAGREQAPVIAFNSHLDTSPETTGANVHPQVVRNYDGSDLVLPGDPQQVIRVSENSELEKLHGCTLITTDGTTLLGGDDKAGLAIIMQTAEFLMGHPEIPHGPVRILFTCDEEIGRGVDHVDLEKLAADVGYTLDGGGANTIDVETFSADMANVTFQGANIHPSIAKDRMVNALRAAGDFLHLLPRNEMSPETTDGRQGFLHPFVAEGGVGEVKLKVLLRDFETAALAQQAALLQQVADQVRGHVPGVEIDVQIIQQYRNLGDGLRKEPRAVDYAETAHRRLGREPVRAIIRGGTDGSLLTSKGLPTPNLSSGQHNPHSPLEWACLDEMVQAAEVLVELAQVWGDDG